MTNVIKAEEYFYAATLDKQGASVTFQQQVTEDLHRDWPERLHIRQILLGHTAKENEYNVVEVEAPSVNGLVKIPIAVLKVGELRVIQSDLEFPDGPVKFTLIEGSGPVYIHGQILPPPPYNDGMAVEEEDEYDLEDEEIEEEEEDNEDNEQPAKKRKVENDAKPNSNKK